MGKIVLLTAAAMLEQAVETALTIPLRPDRNYFLFI
jgi:hypothetical protein